MAQSDMQFTGFANHQLVLNPGSAGSSGAIKAFGAYKQQWTGFGGAPRTTVVGADAEVKFMKNFHGLGALIYNDVVGPFAATNVSVNYSFHAELDKGLLGVGARVGAHNVAFKPSELHPSVDGFEDDFHQSSDPILQGNDESGTAIDVGLGAFYQSKKSYLSLSVLHLNAPTVTTNADLVVSLRPLLTMAAGRKVAEMGRVEVEPRMQLKTDFASWQAEVSSTLTFSKKIYGGLGYRFADAMFAEFGVNMANGVCVGYYYDLNLSALKRYNYGSHEISVSYTFDIDVEKRVKRYKSVRIL